MDLVAQCSHNSMAIMCNMDIKQAYTWSTVVEDMGALLHPLYLLTYHTNKDTDLLFNSNKTKCCKRFHVKTYPKHQPLLFILTPLNNRLPFSKCHLNSIIHQTFHAAIVAVVLILYVLFPFIAAKFHPDSKYMHQHRHQEQFQ